MAGLSEDVPGQSTVGTDVGVPRSPLLAPPLALPRSSVGASVGDGSGVGCSDGSGSVA